MSTKVEPSTALAAAAPAAPISRSERDAYRPASADECYGRLQRYFDQFAPVRDQWRRKNLGYHRELERLYRYHIPKGARVLEIGCGTGDLLAALEPAEALGIDLSPEMIAQARTKYPHLRFEAGAFEQRSATGEMYDYIVLSDLLGFVYDILALFEELKPYCHARTRIVINLHSRLWQGLLSTAEMLGLKYRQPVINWVTTEDVTSMLALAGFETIQTSSRMLAPKHIPLLSRALNRLSPLWPLRPFCLTNWIVARLPMELQGSGVRVQGSELADDEATSTPSLNPEPRTLNPALSVSVICPCRNEAGNIPQIVERLPKLGSHMELIFVEGHSRDETLAACRKAAADHPEMDISVYEQTGKGKKDAVWLGFEKAKGDVLMILDADISVPPEDLTAFYQAIATGRAEFANGSRFVYAMESKAMRFLNMMGNKFFSMAFSWLIGQPVKDTLCGTKVLLRRDYERLAAARSYFGDFDPFGDFDLLFGAARMGLRIVDLPVRYRERTYGETQISRFRHGWMLLKMCGVGLVRLKLR
ncbi:MAG TPA: glycosyltransferase [Planctomycetota bacterium]|jgi:SAM-dependent methyltransferase